MELITLLSRPGQVIERVGEKLVLRFPPDWVVPAGSDREEWKVREVFGEPLAGDDFGTIQGWVVEVVHDGTGTPLRAHLKTGRLSVHHPGRSGRCSAFPDAPVHDIDDEDQHFHVCPPTDERQVALDPIALIETIVRLRRRQGIERGEQSEGALARWKGAVAERIGRRRRVPPEDLLPLVADETIPVRWGANTSWLHGVLVPEKVSLRCLPDEQRATMTFRGLLDEGVDEACAIADDLADALRSYYCRDFAVVVRDAVTGIRGTSGQKP